MGREPDVGEWPLIGRDAELAVVARCLGGRGAVVAGAGGVGKTRLAREAAAAAGATGHPVEAVAATRSAQALPLAPFARFRGEAGAEPEPLVALRQAIVAGRSPGELVLLVDDAHLLDAASAAVVHELCASGAVTVLATVRSREPAPDAVTALWKDDLCERVELQPLSHAEVGRLLEAALAAPVDNATVHTLWNRSRGNVMHLRELVRGGLAGGALHQVGGLWAWSGPLQASPRLAELLADRLAGLDPDERRAVELLALAEPLAWSSLVALVPEERALALVAHGLVETGPDEAHPAETLPGDARAADSPPGRTGAADSRPTTPTPGRAGASDPRPTTRAPGHTGATDPRPTTPTPGHTGATDPRPTTPTPRRAGAVAPGRDGMPDVHSGAAVVDQGGGRLVARLAHPLLGDVLQSELPEPARRRLLAELADLTGADDDPVRAATWRLDAGVPADPGLLVRAARACAFVDARTGERFARAALAAGGRTLAIEVEAAVLLAQHLMLGHRAAAADAALASLEEQELTTSQRVQVAVSRANVLTWGLGRPDAAVAHLDRSAEGLGPDAGRTLTSHAVPMLVFAGRATEAVERAAALASDGATTAVERLRASLGEIPALVVVGRPEQALATANEVFPLVPECRDELPVALAQLGAGITLAQLLSGDLEGAEALMRPGYQEGVARNIPLMRGGAALRLGQVAFWRGRPAQAAALLREAVLALGQADAGLLGWAVDTLRMASALRGERPDPAIQEVAATTLRFPLFVTEAHRADAAEAAAAGEITRARACLRDGLEAARREGHHIQRAVLPFDLARYGDPAGAARALPDVPPLEGALAELLLSAVRALAARDGAALDELSRGFERRGYDLFAAELARAAARAHERQGLRARAGQADARADAIGARCEGATTPLLADRPARNLLTAREREVALLARSQPDRDIAQQLGLSLRTVETHLHRAYAKLGVTGRNQLRDVL